MLLWLKREHDLESEEDHCKFKMLVRGILNGRDTLGGMFDKNSQDPQQSLRKSTSCGYQAADQFWDRYR